MDLSAYTAGGLEVINLLTGASANIGDGIALTVTDEAGNILPIQPLGAVGADDGTNYLNPAASLQALSLASAALAGQDATLIGFEDALATSPDYDGDFNDAIVAVSAHRSSAATVARLAQEARGVVFGTASGDEIDGTRRADKIKGLGGDDDIDGAAGNDRLAGGAGDDELDGGQGRTACAAAPANDRSKARGADNPVRRQRFRRRPHPRLTRADGDVVQLRGYPAVSPVSTPAETGGSPAPTTQSPGPTARSCSTSATAT